jgi:hypothetical protein
MSFFSLDTGFLFEQYEMLRKEALEAESLGLRGHGLSLFLSRGMMVWMAALKALGKHPVAVSEERSVPYRDLPAAVRSDLTVVLADMVLACSKEAGR